MEEVTGISKNSIGVYETVRKVVQTHKNLLTVLTEVDRLLAIPEQVKKFPKKILRKFII